MIFTVEFQVLFAWEGTLIDSTGDVRPQQDWGFVLQVSFLKQLPAPLRAVFAFCTVDTVILNRTNQTHFPPVGFNFLLLYCCAVALAVATSGKITSLPVTLSLAP